MNELEELLSKTSPELIERYEAEMKIADMKNRINTSTNKEIYQDFKQLYTDEQITEVALFMVQLRYRLEDKVSSFALENNLSEFQGFGGSDSSLDALYWITWMGLEKVKEYFNEPMNVIEMFKNKEYRECPWTIDSLVV